MPCGMREVFASLQLSSPLSGHLLLEREMPVASYKIVESKGWPYKTQGITLNGVWYGPPITLEENVVKLHEELFSEKEYKVTNKLKEISEKIIQKTGYR